MPKFFVPPAPGVVDEFWWQQARHRAENAGWNCGAKRIFRLVSGDRVVVEVGERDMGGDRFVVGAIFDAVDVFVLCTMHDTMRELPREGIDAVDFDDDR